MSKFWAIARIFTGCTMIAAGGWVIAGGQVAGIVVLICGVIFSSIGVLEYYDK